MTNHDSHEMPLPPPFPEDNGIYPWSQTPAEASLRETMQEVLSIAPPASQDRYKVTVPIGEFVQSENLPYAAGATHVGLSEYYDTNFTSFRQSHPEIGLWTTLTSRERYPVENQAAEPIEPLRLDVAVSESPEQPGARVEVVVPSRYFTEWASDVDLARQPEEVQPPHARVIIGDGVNVGQLMNQMRFKVPAVGLPETPTERLVSGIDLTEQFFTALDAKTIEGMPVDEFGIRKAEFPLTEEQMAMTTTWLDRLYGGAPLGPIGGSAGRT